MMKRLALVSVVVVFCFTGCATRQKLPVPRGATAPRALSTVVTVTQNGSNVTVNTHDKQIRVRALTEWVSWKFEGAALKQVWIDYKEPYKYVDIPSCSSSSPHDWVCTSSTFPLSCNESVNEYTLRYTVHVITSDGQPGNEDPDIIVQR